MNTINAQTIINAVMQAHACAPDEGGDLISFAISAKGIQKVKNCKANLLRFADLVRKNARAFGGGIVRTIKPRAAVIWPAQAARLVYELLQDEQHQDAAALAEEKCGAVFYEGYNHKIKAPQAFMMWAPQAVAGLPECLRSARVDSGRYCVYDIASGMTVSGHHKTRANAEASAVTTWQGVSEEKRAEALAKAKPSNPAAARAQWMAEHEIISKEATAERIEAEALAQEEAATLGQRFDAERAKRRAARDAERAAQAVAQVVADAVAAVAISDAMQASAAGELVTCEAGENEAQRQSMGHAAGVPAWMQSMTSGSADKPSAFRAPNTTPAQHDHDDGAAQEPEPTAPADQAPASAAASSPARAPRPFVNQVADFEARGITWRVTVARWWRAALVPVASAPDLLCWKIQKQGGRFGGAAFVLVKGSDMPRDVAAKAQAFYLAVEAADQSQANHPAPTAAAPEIAASVTPCETSENKGATESNTPQDPDKTATAATETASDAPKYPRQIVPANGLHIVDAAFEAWTYHHEKSGKFGFVMYLGKSAKPWAFYGYATEAKRNDGFERHATEARDIAASKAKRAQDAKAQADKPHGLQAGDVVRSSWGYDQTNVDHYQIIKVIGKRTVEVRKLAEHDDPTGDMSGRVSPIHGEFVGDVLRRQVDKWGQVNIRQASYGRASKIEPLATVHGVRCYEACSYSNYA